MSSRRTPGRKLLKRACDACKVRKIKCSELPPCEGCTAAGVSCTFKKIPTIRGPRSLRPKTVQQIQKQQGTLLHTDSDPTCSLESPDAQSTPSSHSAASTLAGALLSASSPTTSVASLVLRLCIYRLRLYPIWPIVAVEDIMASLQRDEGNMGTYALANAVGAATMAQLKLDHPSDSATAGSMEAECQRARRLDAVGRNASLDTLRCAFFLHAFHENQEPGGVQSLMYLREAITLAQIMGLHRESAYASLSSSEQDIRRRIIWLLFVTERGVAMLHKLPVVLECNARFPSTESDDGGHSLPAFRKLVNLFWMFDHSGAFAILQDTEHPPTDGVSLSCQSSLDFLQQCLQDVPIDWESSNDVQRADICVTRQWMRAVLWKASLRISGSGHATQLSHPIQIANEFLCVFEKLPAAAIEAHGPSIEFKIYEIASAVADSVTKNVRGWVLSQNAKQVLTQLHQILSSCRGGNPTLSSMLQSKIVQIHDQQPLLRQPSPRVQELSDPWLDPVRAPMDLNVDDNSSRRPMIGLDITASSQNEGDDKKMANNRDMEELGSFSTSPKTSWLSTLGDEFTMTPVQMQNHDGSFDALQHFETLDLFLSDNDIIQRALFSP